MRVTATQQAKKRSTLGFLPDPHQASAIDHRMQPPYQRAFQQRGLCNFPPFGARRHEATRARRGQHGVPGMGETLRAFAPAQAIGAHARHPDRARGEVDPPGAIQFDKEANLAGGGPPILAATQDDREERRRTTPTLVRGARVRTLRHGGEVTPRGMV